MVSNFFSYAYLPSYILGGEMHIQYYRHFKKWVVLLLLSYSGYKFYIREFSTICTLSSLLTNPEQRINLGEVQFIMIQWIMILVYV